MRRYILRKLFEAATTMLALTFIVFSAVHITGDPADFLLQGLIEIASDETIVEMRRRMGLDKPFIVQYGLFMKRMVTSFDFGESFTNQRTGREMILERFPFTLQLAGAALALAIVIGTPLGILSAIKRDSILDRVGKAFAIFGFAVPQFWLAIMLVLLFGAKLKWLPTYGPGGIDHLVLPAIVLAVGPIAVMMRLARSGMLEILDSEYIKFARVKGLDERLVIWKHAARNAMIPLLTFGGILVAALLNGSVVVEQVFAWPGVGRLMLEGVLERNMPLVQATVLASGFFYICMSLIIDIMYGLVDPRIRHR